MKDVSIGIALSRIRNYLSSDVYTPFFVVVDESNEYVDLVDELGALRRKRVSGYCANEDSFPDYDSLYDALSEVAQDTLLLGLGESIRLSGDEIFLSRLKDLNARFKVVVFCRGIRDAVKRLCSDDKKFGTERRVCFLKAAPSYDVIKLPSSLSVAAEEGLKSLLNRLEGGASASVYVKTALPLKNVREVRSAHNVIRLVDPTFTVHSDCLQESHWAEYLEDKNLDGYGLFHWRNFLKFKQEPPRDIYLQYVLKKATNYDNYKRLLYMAVLDFSWKDDLFSEMYEARKSLLKGVTDSDIAEYIAETKVKDDDRVFYLTDNTAAERQAMIEALSGKSDIPVHFEAIYPDLSAYLHDYTFTGNKGELLTEYFAEYKRQKLFNRLSPEFCDKVSKLAVDGSRPYNSLKTRGEVLDSLKKDDTALYWIDALGVEFVGYIQRRAQSLGLRITVHIVRANLPTITSFNNDFYETWRGLKHQTKKLDDLKHNGEQDFNFETTKLPIHLPTELQIIENVLEWAAKKLTGKEVGKVLLVSDHGASRLAVINEQECKWKMASKGKHSGRCCPSDEADVKSEYATLENGFWVLANYDRFKGGRKASVEVHGGATLEEVVVPLVEVELFDNKITVSNTTPITTSSFRKNAEIVLFSTSALKNVSVSVNGKQYSAEAIGNQKHKVVFPDIKRTGKYTVDVYEDDNLIGQMEFEVQRESGGTNDEDWF
ncbi:MAG: BREX-4 system phosphatase PglZ [Planctomycetota bacterium]